MQLVSHALEVNQQGPELCCSREEAIVKHVQQVHALIQKNVLRMGDNPEETCCQQCKNLNAPKVLMRVRAREVLDALQPCKRQKEGHLLGLNISETKNICEGIIILAANNSKRASIPQEIKGPAASRETPEKEIPI